MPLGIEKLPDFLKAGGFIAFGLTGLALFLSWPHQAIGTKTGVFGPEPVLLDRYSNHFGVSGVSYNDAFAFGTGMVLFAAVLGAAIGQLLITWGVVSGKDIGVDE